MAETTITKSTNAGHRERLRKRFINNEEGTRSDAALLELLLTYAVPVKDVRPMADQLLATYGDLPSVLDAPLKAIIQVKGIKEHSAILLKLVDYIRRETNQTHCAETDLEETQQVSLLEGTDMEPPNQEPNKKNYPKPKVIKRYGTALFAKAVLAEAIDILPSLPDSESLDEIRAFLRLNLHFNAELTRTRYASYITKRLFIDGYSDEPLRSFAKVFPKSQELRDVCFYRFMRAEPLEMEIVEDLLIPNIGAGSVTRERIRDNLKERFPESNSISDSAKAVVDALKAGGIVTANAKSLSFAYRDIPPDSFAFVLHSEYPEPGMYNIESLDNNRLVRAMLWNPERMSYALYELRNRGLISKISEIDGIRQFTTKYTLAEAVKRLTAEFNDR